VNDMKMKANKTRNELKVSDLNTYGLKVEERTKNGRRTTENLHGFAHGNVLEALWKHLSLDFLHGNTFFSPKTAEMHSIGVNDQFTQPSSPIYSQNGEVLAAQRLLEEDF